MVLMTKVVILDNSQPIRRLPPQVRRQYRTSEACKICRKEAFARMRTLNQLTEQGAPRRGATQPNF